MGAAKFRFLSIENFRYNSGTKTHKQFNPESYAMAKKTILILFALILLLLASACGADQSQEEAVQVVEQYFQALIEKNESLLVSSVCSSYEESARMDFNTFAIVRTSLEDLSCQKTGSTEGGLNVNCQGSLQASFGEEIRSFDLSKRTYQVFQENGTWLICGHTDEN